MGVEMRDEINNATSELTANKKTKDSVFTNLFDDIKNIRKLYNSFYNDGDLYSDDDFVLLTLENIFVKSVGETKLEAVVKIIKEEDCKNSILLEYIRFSKIHTENLKQCPSEPLRAIRTTIEYCIENGILAEYLIERKVEVKDMLMTLLTEDEVIELMLKEKLAEGKEENKFEVVKNMLSEGFDYNTIHKITKISENDFKKIQAAM